MSLDIREVPFGNYYLSAGLLGVLVFSIIGASRQLYGSWRFGSLTNELAQVWVAWFLTCAVLMASGFAWKLTAIYSRIAISVWFVAAPALLSLDRLLVRQGLVNIGSDEMVTIDQLADLAMGIAGKKLTRKHIPGPLGVRGRNSDNRLIFERLGWKPSRPLKDGFEITYRWIEQQVRKLREASQ